MTTTAPRPTAAPTLGVTVAPAPTEEPTAAPTLGVTVAPAPTEEPTGEEPTITPNPGEDSPLALAEERFAAFEQQLNAVQPGEMLFNPPAEMQIDQSEVIVVRLSRNPGDPGLSVDVPGSGVAMISTVESVGMYMNVRLSGEAFDIRALSEEEQIIPEEGYTEWSWQVIPIRSGSQKLFLNVSMSIEISKDDVKRRSLPVIQKDVYIQVNPLHTVGGFVGKNWEVLISLPVVTTVASYVARRFLNRRKAKKEA